MSLQGGLGTERMCGLVGLSRSRFYRYLRAQDPWDEEMGVRSEIQRIALEHQGRYGYRRMTAELRRRGMLVNHKRVARLMSEDSLIGTKLESSSVSVAMADANGEEVALPLPIQLTNQRISLICEIVRGRETRFINHAQREILLNPRVHTPPRIPIAEESMLIKNIGGTCPNGLRS